VRREKDEEQDALAPSRPAEVDRPGEPPVVARLIVEIRSDGRRTIARGAMEDPATGRAVAIEATGRSPFQLALSLARSLVTLPAFGRTAARALLGASLPRRGRGGSRRGGGSNGSANGAPGDSGGDDSPR
jgi:hypothetical protein